MSNLIRLEVENVSHVSVNRKIRVPNESKCWARVLYLCSFQKAKVQCAFPVMLTQALWHTFIRLFL